MSRQGVGLVRGQISLAASACPGSQLLSKPTYSDSIRSITTVIASLRSYPDVGEAMSDRWVSVTDVAEYLGISRDTIYRWIETKGLPAYRVGRHWKLKLEDVDRWVRQSGANEAASILRGSED